METPSTPSPTSPLLLWYNTQDWHAFTNEAIVLPSISGSLSLISSITIMAIIFRSKQNTQYHRILFLMSFFDSLVSFAFALTTLPMPREVQDNEFYNYQGHSFGTIETCEAQAFTILFGLAMVVFSNTFLNTYYLLTIRYHISEDKFRKFCEPIFFLISIPISLVMPVLFLKRGHFNPGPYETHCDLSLFPLQCFFEGVDCIHGDPSTLEGSVAIYRNFSISVLIFQSIFLIVTMIMILLTTCNPCTKNNEERDNAERDFARSQNRNISLQAGMYIGAWFLTWFFNAFSFFENESSSIAALSDFFLPLQGFFNLLIFVYLKVISYRSIHEDSKNTFEIIRMLLSSPQSFVDRYNTISNLEFLTEVFPVRSAPKLADVSIGENSESKLKQYEHLEEHEPEFTGGIASYNGLSNLSQLSPLHFPENHKRSHYHKVQLGVKREGNENKEVQAKSGKTKM